MSLECLRGIITNNLALQLDLTNLKSWDLNTGLTVTSLTKWSGAISDNISLMDFGLTAFDNARMNKVKSKRYIKRHDRNREYENEKLRR